MSQRLLHTLIGLGLVGVFMYFATDVFNNDYIPDTAVSKPKIISPSPEPTEGLSDCLGPYIHVQEGAQWNYRIITTTEMSGTNSEKKREVSNIIVTLEKKEVGKMLFTTVDSATNKQTRSETVCKLSGIYGLPVLTTLQTMNIIPVGLLDEIFHQIQFIPNRKVYKNKEWSSTIDIASALPIKFQNTPIGINFQVLEEKNRFIKGKKYETVSIKSSSTSKGPIDLGSLFTISYDLGENIGFVDGTMEFKVPTKGVYTIEISLLSFLNPL